MQSVYNVLFVGQETSGGWLGGCPYPICSPPAYNRVFELLKQMSSTVLPTSGRSDGILPRAISSPRMLQRIRLKYSCRVKLLVPGETQEATAIGQHPDEPAEEPHR